MFTHIPKHTCTWIQECVSLYTLIPTHEHTHVHLTLTRYCACISVYTHKSTPLHSLTIYSLSICTCITSPILRHTIQSLVRPFCCTHAIHTLTYTYLYSVLMHSYLLYIHTPVPSHAHILHILPEEFIHTLWTHLIVTLYIHTLTCTHLSYTQALMHALMCIHIHPCTYSHIHLCVHTLYTYMPPKHSKWICAHTYTNTHSQVNKVILTYMQCTWTRDYLYTCS